MEDESLPVFRIAGDPKIFPIRFLERNPPYNPVVEIHSSREIRVNGELCSDDEKIVEALRKWAKGYESWEQVGTRMSPSP